ncbi:MAG: DUF1007 family protein [Nitratireductor sp.]|nr:DUF1007 family protein [Nitratireductor sp.]
MTVRKLGLAWSGAVFAACILPLAPPAAFAHPHVWIEANLEIVRNEAGEATQIRHVWRFDELFSSSLILDFDENGNGELDRAELDTIGKETRQSLGEYNFYTEVRNGEAVVDFYEPDPYLVDWENGRLIMIMALELTAPQKIGPQGFKVAVSDPTYYVAVELTSEDPVKVSGKGADCTYDITVPDWDALYARDAQKLADLFSAGADEKVEASDDYLTWINFSCPS